MMEKLSRIWCEIMHDSPMWPAHGRYECRTCGRQYPVVWEAKTAVKPSRVGWQPAADWQSAR